MLLYTVLFAGVGDANVSGTGDTIHCYNAQISGDHFSIAQNSASNGQLNWGYTTKCAVYSSPIVSNGIVYVGSYDHNVYALNAATGAKVWSYDTGGPVSD